MYYINFGYSITPHFERHYITISLKTQNDEIDNDNIPATKLTGEESVIHIQKEKASPHLHARLRTCFLIKPYYALVIVPKSHAMP